MTELLAMENASFPSDISTNLTTSSSKDDDLTPYRVYELALKVVYMVVGTVGVLDNLFVIIIFALFIKITNKVLESSLSFGDTKST